MIATVLGGPMPDPYCEMWVPILADIPMLLVMSAFTASYVSITAGVCIVTGAFGVLAPRPYRDD